MKTEFYDDDGVGGCSATIIMDGTEGELFFWMVALNDKLGKRIADVLKFIEANKDTTALKSVNINSSNHYGTLHKGKRTKRIEMAIEFREGELHGSVVIQIWSGRVATAMEYDATNNANSWRSRRSLGDVGMLEFFHKKILGKLPMFSVWANR